MVKKTGMVVLLTGALLINGCKGNLRDKNEELRRPDAEVVSSPEERTNGELADTNTDNPTLYAMEEEELSLQGSVEAAAPAREEAADAVSETQEQPNEQPEEQREILEKYSDLLAIDPYVAGWLKIDDTVIDYPVVYTPASQNFFLHRGIDGRENSSGSLFIAVNWWEGADQTLIYGHNMKDGSSFGTLLKFADEAYGRNHHLIHFDTLYEEDEYELYGVFYSQIDEEEIETEEDREEADRAIAEEGIEKKAEEEGTEAAQIEPRELTLFDLNLTADFGDADLYRAEKDEDNGRFRYYYYTDLSDPADFEYFARNVKERSLYDMGIEAEPGDRFVTLSTCSYQVTNGRFVVVGIKKNNSQ